MEDQQIIELYFARSERAIAETDHKYGKYCHKIAFNILSSREDSEECVSDTYLRTWNAIPPRRPNVLKLFLGKITRNLALDRFDKYTAAKRGRGEVSLSLEELGECVPDRNTPEAAIENRELVQVLNRFLATLPVESRKIFLMRYWNLSPVRDIAAYYGITESKVKVTLMRTRGKLRECLEKGGDRSMKQKRLLEAIGWVKDEYIEEMLDPAMEREVRRTPKKKLWLIAAVIAALLLTGCAAVILMRLEDLTMHQEVMTEPNVETTWVRTRISLQGVAGSPTFQATKEWEEFLRGYDPDNKIIQSTPRAEMDQGEEYYSYNCYTREMADKIDEICEKYGLQKQGRFQPEQSMENVCHVLRVDELVKTDENFEIVDASGYMYRSGTFDLQGSLILRQMEKTMTFDIHCISKTDFNGFSGSIGDIEDYTQWNVTTKDGVDVLLVLGKEDGLMIADLDGYFCNVSLHDSADSPYDTGHESRIRKEDLEDLAERFNFSIHLGPVSDEDWAYMENNKIEYESTPLGTYPGGTFDEHVRLYFENNPNADILEYALMDVDGTEGDELLIGKDGFVRVIFATDGKDTFMTPFVYLMVDLKESKFGDSGRMVVPSYGQICEGKKALYVFVATNDITTYLIADSENGRLDWTTRLREDHNQGTYYKAVGHGRELSWERDMEITKAEFDEILSACVPIDVPMTPLTEYPFE